MAAHALPENASRQLTEWLAASHGFYTAYTLRGDQAAAEVMAGWTERHAADILVEAADERQSHRWWRQS